MNLQIRLTDLPNAIHQLIVDPTSNLVAASLGLAIVVIFVLMLAIAALALLLPHEDEDDAAEDETPAEVVAPEPPQAAKRAARPWVRTAVVVALLAVAAGSAYAGTSTTEYCGNTCHSMVEPASGWKRSPHAKVACVACHESSAFTGVVSRARHAFDAATGQGTAPQATVSGVACLHCHRKIARQTVTTKGGVRVRHADFLSAGMTCTECHENVGHTAVSAAGTGTMSACLRCHDGNKASAKCATCHVGDVGQAVVMERSFSKVELPKPTCGGCHGQTECDACHGLRMPHPANFADPHQHARLAAFGGRKKLCYRCHEPNDCNKCHVNLDTGHASDWITYHQRYKRSDGNGYCLACHKTKDFCGVCH